MSNNGNQPPPMQMTATGSSQSLRTPVVEQGVAPIVPQTQYGSVVGSSTLVNSAGNDSIQGTVPVVQAIPTDEESSSTKYRFYRFHPGGHASMVPLKHRLPDQESIVMPSPPKKVVKQPIVKQPVVKSVPQKFVTVERPVPAVSKKTNMTKSNPGTPAKLPTPVWQEPLSPTNFHCPRPKESRTYRKRGLTEGSASVLSRKKAGKHEEINSGMGIMMKPVPCSEIVESDLESDLNREAQLELLVGWGERLNYLDYRNMLAAQSAGEDVLRFSETDIRPETLENNINFANPQLKGPINKESYMAINSDTQHYYPQAPLTVTGNSEKTLHETGAQINLYRPEIHTPISPITLHEVNVLLNAESRYNNDNLYFIGPNAYQYSNSIQNNARTQEVHGTENTPSPTVGTLLATEPSTTTYITPALTQIDPNLEDHFDCGPQVDWFENSDFFIPEPVIENQGQFTHTAPGYRDVAAERWNLYRGTLGRVPEFHERIKASQDL